MNTNPVSYEVNQFISNYSYFLMKYDLSNELLNLEDDIIYDSQEELVDLVEINNRNWYIKIFNNSLILKQLSLVEQKIIPENENILNFYEILFPNNLISNYSIIKENSNTYYITVFLKNLIIYVITIENDKLKCYNNGKLKVKIWMVKESNIEIIKELHIFKKQENFFKFSFKINKKPIIYLYKVTLDFIKKLEYNNSSIYKIDLYKSINYSNISNSLVNYLISYVYQNKINLNFSYRIINNKFIIVLEDNIFKIINIKKMKVEYTRTITKIESMEKYKEHFNIFFIKNELNIIINLINYDLDINKIYFFKFEINKNNNLEEKIFEKFRFNIGEFKSLNFFNDKIFLNYYDKIFKISKIISWDIKSNTISIPYLINYDIFEKYLNFNFIKDIKFLDLKNLIIDRIFKNKYISNEIIGLSLESLLLKDSNNFNIGFINNYSNIERKELLNIFKKILKNIEKLDSTEKNSLIIYFYEKIISNYNSQNIIKNIKIDKNNNILLIKNNLSYSILKFNEFFKNIYNIRVKVFEYISNNYFFDQSFNKSIGCQNFKIEIFKDININIDISTKLFIDKYLDFINKKMECKEFIRYDDLIDLCIYDPHTYNLENKLKDYLINNINNLQDLSSIFDINEDIINNSTWYNNMDFNHNYIIDIIKIKNQSDEIENFNDNYIMAKIFKLMLNSDINSNELILIKRNYLINKILKENVLGCNNKYFNDNSLDLKLFFNNNYIVFRDLFVISNNLLSLDNDTKNNNILLDRIVDFKIILKKNNDINTKRNNLYNIILFLEEIQEFSIMKYFLDLLDKKSIITSYYYLFYYVNNFTLIEFKEHYSNFIQTYKKLLDENYIDEFYSWIFFYKRGKYSYNKNFGYKLLYQDIIINLYMKISSINNYEIKKHFYNEIIKDDFLEDKSKCNILKNYINLKVDKEEIIDCFNIIKNSIYDKKLVKILFESLNDSIIDNNKIKLLVQLKINDFYILRVIDEYLIYKKDYFLNKLYTNNKEIKYIFRGWKNLILYKEKLSFYYNDYNDALYYGFDLFIRLKENLLLIDNNIIKDFKKEIYDFELFLLNNLLIFLNHNSNYNFDIKNISNSLKNIFLNSMIVFEYCENYNIKYDFLYKTDIEKFKIGLLLNNDNIENNKNYEYLIKYLICSDRIKDAYTICFNNEIWVNFLLELLFFSLINNTEGNLNINPLIYGFNLILKSNIKYPLTLLNLYISVLNNIEISENKKFNDEIQKLINDYIISTYPEKLFIFLCNSNNNLLSHYFNLIFENLEIKIKENNKQSQEVKECWISMTYYMNNSEDIYKEFIDRHRNLINMLE